MIGGLNLSNSQLGWNAIALREACFVEFLYAGHRDG